MFREGRRIFRQLDVHIRNMSAQIDTPAVRKATQMPYIYPEDQEPKISSV